jgi:Uma2 family endonuclease
MVSMTRPDLWHDPGRLLTVDDLADLPPGDDRRYELDDGVLIVSPAPLNVHQLVVTRLTLILAAACPGHLAVLAGVGINITRFQHRVPDVAVVPADSFELDHVERPPALVVEVSSRSTRLYDRNRKKDVYESFGIPAYWIFEPERDRPRLIAHELDDGKYDVVADLTGEDEFRASAPFEVNFRPAMLVTTGPLPGHRSVR